MPETGLFALLVCAVLGFLWSSTWYATFGARWIESEGAVSTAGRPPAWKIGVELLRNAVLAGVLAGLAARCGAAGWIDGLLLGLSLWLGFPLVLWAGAMTWEGTPARVAAAHGLDWLVKLLGITVIVSVWG